MMRESRTHRAWLTAGTALLTAGLLAGCDAVGEGVAPTGITIQPDFSGTGLSTREAEAAQEAFDEGAPFRIAECLPAAMSVILEFDSGARENITRRSENVVYSSSDESVVRVSNRDIPFLGNPDQVFPRGAIVPVAPGSATITVNYSNFSADIPIEVQALGAIDPFVDFPEVLAPNSFAEVVSEATVNGQTLSVATAAALSLTDVNSGEESEAAQVESTQSRVLIRGLEAATAQRAELDFELCGRTFEREFRVADIAELQLARPDDDGQPLAIGFSELLTATAVFGDGSTLDLSNQARFSASEDSQNLLLFPEAAAGGNSLVLGLSGLEDDEEEEAGDDTGNGAGDGDDAVGDAEGTGGTGTANATFDQDPTDDADLEEGEADPTQVDADPLSLTVRPGRVDALRWQVPRNDDGDRVIEVPQDCSVKPGVEGEMRIALEDGSKAEVTRRIDREANYLIGDESLDPEEDPGNSDDEESDPIVEVVDRTTLSTQRRAGTITAVGEVGDEERVRAVLIQSVTLPGFDDVDNGEEETFVIEDELIVRVVERVDCASVENAADLQ
ncbi:hypothetical protein [Algiphilus sp.]|uniref:hypothetical protein n=1 Tax=Algiphilus sp. TaxID=1872431 RepID=UPI003C47914C